jgi:hypothetical protein
MAIQLMQDGTFIDTDTGRVINGQDDTSTDNAAPVGTLGSPTIVATRANTPVAPSKATRVSAAVTDALGSFDVIKAAKRRIRALRAEIKRLRAHEKELAKLERLIAAAEKPLALVHDIKRSAK